MRRVAYSGPAEDDGWRMCLRNVLHGAVLDMTIGCCMHSGMQWVSRYRGCNGIDLGHRDLQTPAGQFAMGSCSAVDGKTRNVAYQPPAHHRETRLLVL